MQRLRMPGRSSFAGVAVVAALLLAPSLVAAEAKGWVALPLRFGGEAEFDLDGPGAPPNDDMELGFGVAGGYDVALHRNFMLGGRLELLSLQSDGGDDVDADRLRHVAVGFAPTARVEVAPRWTLFATLPLGVGYASFDSDALQEDGPLLHIGLLFGAMYDFGGAALRTELGYTHHVIYSEIELPVLGTQDVDIGIDQFALTVGVAF